MHDIKSRHLNLIECSALPLSPNMKCLTCIRISAYTENGSVLITVGIPAGKNGVLNFNVPTQISPREDVYGSIGYPSSDTDFGKILVARVKSSGQMMIWVNEVLDLGEFCSFSYPLKS